MLEARAKPPLKKVYYQAQETLETNYVIVTERGLGQVEFVRQEKRRGFNSTIQL